VLRSILRERLRARLRDARSTPASTGDAPAAGTFVDALDRHAYWRLFDALCDAAFGTGRRDLALGDTPEQRDMGRWSDGVPVAPLRIVDAPPAR
jgi:hypothetical protein